MMLLAAAIKKAVAPHRIRFSIERPEDATHGDYATNAAFLLAPILKKKPLDVAQELVDKFRNDKELLYAVERIEVAPPGFVNFFLAPVWLHTHVGTIMRAGTAYGATALRRFGKNKVQVEFISANPTGPLTLGNGRGGFLGDALSNVLAAAGYEVTREYYVNDAGEQVRKLGASVLAAAGYKVPYEPEELYQGEYVRELAGTLEVQPPKEVEPPHIEKLVDAVAREASKTLLIDIKRVTKKLKVRFDAWFSEKSLHRQGIVDEVLKTLKRKRLTEEKEGALWLKTKETAGVEKDKVLVKSNGEPTYLLPDLAYHLEKFKRRKFRRVIDIVGADHHGHMNTLRIGLRAMGLPEPEVILVQLVRLVENGKEVKMSKRAGTFVTLEELVDEVGLDAARWFFLQRAPHTHLDFDLALAKERSEKNPVYYVQYAHARICAIVRKFEKSQAPSSKSQTNPKGKIQNPKLELLLHPSEISLIKQLILLPELVEDIAQSYQVHQLTTYATDVATAFSAFYRDCRVISEDKELSEARLALCQATQIVLRNTLGLMGIRAPEKM